MEQYDDLGSFTEKLQQNASCEQVEKPSNAGGESHSNRHEHNRSMDVGSRFGRVRDHLGHLRQLRYDLYPECKHLLSSWLTSSRLFFYLAVLAATMVVINIIQAGLIDRIHSIVWVTVFPGSVLAASMLAIGLQTRLSREVIMPEWREAPGEPRKSALAPIQM